MATTTQPTALITGASSGIGFELTRLFARDGYHLVLVARNQARLDAQAAALAKEFKVPVTVIAKDLAQPSAAASIAGACERAGVHIDVLVNNAGFATWGQFTTTDLMAETGMIQVNITALTQLTKLLLNGMIARGRGRILNVASTAAFQPGPLMAVYCASKAYVLSFSEALADELAGSGVTATVLCPGLTDTGFVERAEMAEAKLLKGGAMDAATVALAGYRGLMAGKTLVIPGLRNRFLAWASRLVPRRWATAAARRKLEAN